MKTFRQLALPTLALGLFLVACGGNQPEPEPETTGSISGTLTRIAPATADALAAASASAAAAVQPAAIVPGEVFVVFRSGRPDTQFGIAADPEGFSFHADGGFEFGGAGFAAMEFVQARAYPVDTGLALYRTEGLTEADTRALIDALQATDAVAEAFPNWILEAQQLVPDDEYYDIQAWHYEQLNLPAAWEIENGTGAPEQVAVAVLDTGAFAHPDIVWGVGANTADWEAGAPGSGTVDDPFTGPGGSDHGTHVAGTVGATTDNGQGAAGVNWDAYVTPVKVLNDSGSGSFAGILEGLFWALGDDNPAYGGHVNPVLPRVINMSLGGNILAECPEAVDAGIFGLAVGMDIVTVVAAGNSGAPAEWFFPANCANVITVGATGPTGARSYYSNYGHFVDVFAPGGDFDFEHPENPAWPAGVFSLVDPAFGAYDLFEGTSMASPHVAGIVSLMLALEPGLAFDDVLQRLRNASDPLTLAQCSVPVHGVDGQNMCGAGLIDAAAALLGETVTTPSAFVYAIPFDDEAPEIALGNYASLELLAQHSVEATAAAGGDFNFAFEELEEGSYLLVGLELRDADTGISSADRVGFLEVEVVAGEDASAVVVVDPIYLQLR